MKKKNFFMALVLGVVSMFAFSACSNEDDGPMVDPASAIEGTYVGHGQLEIVGLTGMPLEEYAGMKMEVTKSSNEFVIVTPYEANGTPFFANGNGHVFQITQSASGDFMLTSSDKPNCRVSITKSRAMTYSFPYVSVGGESGYALTFTGSRQ